ncbi:MAG TPA: protocatechuate 3,4-dioxygenase subunit beta [Myxococcota bacterium]|nr:protocatechuate 3,4-dioxygenase subunit beta [Myxococcota bacterium]
MTSFRTDDREVHPPLRSPDYRSTRLRVPLAAPIPWRQGLSELTGPDFGGLTLVESDWDLTRQAAGEPLGERISVSGRIVDEDGGPLPGQLIEIWQANAAGRYAHPVDQHAAPLDPHFSGVGRCMSDAEGRYRFVTIKPGAYPWQNHANAWRPAHIHFSLFGPAFATRLVTQMYFPGDPLLELDPIYLSVPADARERLIARFDLETTQPEWALGYRFDLVLRGREATPRGL